MHIKPYFLGKIKVKKITVSSAAILHGSLRVNHVVQMGSQPNKKCTVFLWLYLRNRFAYSNLLPNISLVGGQS